MKIFSRSVGFCILLGGCQTIPWSETGPLMKFVNISTGPQECMALADLSGSIIIKNGKAVALASPGCKSVKDGLGVYQADSIQIKDTLAREVIVKFSWGGWVINRYTPVSWKWTWLPPKKTVK